MLSKKKKRKKAWETKQTKGHLPDSLKFMSCSSSFENYLGNKITSPARLFYYNIREQCNSTFWLKDKILNTELSDPKFPQTFLEAGFRYVTHCYNRE